MTHSIKPTAALLCLLIAGPTVSAHEQYVYPAADQTDEQMEADKYACHQFAVQQTGFDPTKASAPAATPPPSGQQNVGRGVGRGLLGGGGVGALVGAVAGNAKKGAAIGATTGALVGGARAGSANKQQQQAHQQQQQAQATAHQQDLSDYQRASSACLEGRGYTVR